MAKTKKIIAVAVAGAAAWGLWTAGSALMGDEEATGTQHAVNQVWIERIPQGPRDMIGHLVLLDLPEGRIGAVGRSSQWRHFLEAFKYGLEGHRLSIYFPQEQVNGHFKVRTWRCEGEAPEPFELCLEISDGRRSQTMYSLEEWHIDPDDRAGSLAQIAEDYPSLANSLSSVTVPVAIDETVTEEAMENYTPSDVLAPLGLR